MTMTQHDAPSTSTTQVSSVGTGGRGRPVGLILAVITLSVAVLGLGIWILVDRGDESTTQLPDDVDQVLADYLESWNTYDGDLFLATTSDDYYLHTERYGDWGRTAQAGRVGDSVTHDWHTEWIDDPVVVGDGPWYVAAPTRVTSDMHPEGGIVGIDIFALARDDDGTPKVLRHIVQTGSYESYATLTSR